MPTWCEVAQLVVNHLPMSRPALEIKKLSKSFSGNRVVKEISLQIEEGEIFGLLGPNGAGKSTTINMITGITKIDSGEITVFGHDNRREYKQARRLIGVMHQEFVSEPFFKIGRGLSIHAGYYGVEDDVEWRNLLIERLALRPHLNKKFITLSGGMKRRYMAAKALIHKPRLLILDEPTAGVDVELRRSLWKFVREINSKGVTVLLTTHYLEEAEEMCSRIAIMKEGAIVALEKTSDLVRQIGEREVRFTIDGDVTPILNKLSRLSPKWSPETATIEFRLCVGDEVAPILSAFHESSVKVLSIETAQPDLEDVFLKLTGI